MNSYSKEVGINTAHIRNEDLGNLPQELNEIMLMFEKVMTLKLDREYLDSHRII
jgi:hypothetical protein